MTCAGLRKPMMAVRHGEGILDTIIQVVGRAAGKVAASAPDAAQMLLKAGV